MVDLFFDGDVDLVGVGGVGGEEEGGFGGEVEVKEADEAVGGAGVADIGVSEIGVEVEAEADAAVVGIIEGVDGQP